MHSGHDWPHPVNIEKIVVIPDQDPSDISPEVTIEPQVDIGEEQTVTPYHSYAANPDLAEVGYRIAKYLEALPSKSAVSSQVCKFIYE